MSSVGKGRGARESRERARVYEARRRFHDGLSRRRTRDNLIAGFAGGAAIAAVVLVQTLYFTSGPGAPLPEPTASATSAPTESSTPEPSSSPSPAASDSPTPTATP